MIIIDPGTLLRPPVYLGYKVVSDCLYFWSLSYYNHLIPLILCYEIGKPIKRPNNFGPLAVFDELKWAQFFVDHNYGIIFECHYVLSMDQKLWYIDGNGARIDAGRVSPGTEYADEVTILRRVT